MRLFLKALKWLGIGVAGLIGLVILAYGVLVVINWSDEPPSEAALYFEAPDYSLDELLDPANAVPYAIGLKLPREEDPRGAGAEWLEWTQLPLNKQRETEEPLPASALTDPWDVLWPFIRACGEDINSQCRAFIETEREDLRSLLDENRWLLQRYDRLFDYTVWKEPVLQNEVAALTIAVPDNGLVMLHKLHVLELARAGQFQAALELLEREARFFRFALEKTNTFIGRTMFASWLRRNLYWTNEILRLAGTENNLAVPAVWEQPLTPSERSIRRVVASDLVMTHSLIEEMRQDDEAGFKWRFLEPLFQAQGMVNLQAEAYLKIEDALTGNLTELPAAIKAFYEWQQEQPPLRMYNPVGHYYQHAYQSVTFILGYSLSVTDLESTRRALILEHQLRAEDVADENIPAWLANADIRNPYTDEPFCWDTEAGAITYEPLSPDEDASLNRVFGVLWCALHPWKCFQETVKNAFFG